MNRVNHATHLSALLIAIALGGDLLFGDPEWLPHPVRFIGATIAIGERRMYTGGHRTDRRNGRLLTIGIVGLTALVTYLIVSVADRLGSSLGATVAVLIAWTSIALRGLDDAALRVERALIVSDLSAARAALPALVGRDPNALDAEGIARATVESVAENTNDAVIAPMLFLFIAGPVGALAYKAINTLDSMIGYRDERYMHFGRAAARLDDFANWFPARIAAFSIAAAAELLLGTGRRALAIRARDARQHDSPNAGHPESAMAGALGVQLGGDAVYGGELEPRAALGDAENPVTPQSIELSRSILRYSTAIAFVGLTICRYVITR
jgi:adenosylcobinamide-phosphate synthase